MSGPLIFRQTVRPDQAGVVYARLPYLDLSDDTEKDLTVSLVSSIAWNSKVKSTGVSVTSGTLTVASVIFDSLLTYEGESYNFRAELPGTAWPDGSTQYQIDIVATLTSGKESSCLAHVTTIPFS